MCIKSQPSQPTEIIFDDPVDYPTKDIMEFRLVYAGALLKAAGPGKGRVWEKHQIRRYLHVQLKNLWETHPLLNFYAQPNHFAAGGLAGRFVQHYTNVASVAEHFEGYVPVVNGDFGMVCELDILFLRSEPIGKLLSHSSGSGDIDNRMKVLFDALCFPKRGQVKLRTEDDPDPSPMFCLLADDALITAVRITTDRLLTGAEGDDNSEACIVIHVNVKGIDPTRSPYSLPI